MRAAQAWFQVGPDHAGPALLRPPLVSSVSLLLAEPHPRTRLERRLLPPRPRHRLARARALPSRFLEDPSRMRWSGAGPPIVRSSWRLSLREGARVDE